MAQKGSAYVYVLIIMLMIGLMLGVALRVSAVSRSTSARYQNYASLYDLAIAGNEKAFFIMRDFLSALDDEIDSNARAHIAANNFSQHLIYRQGIFHLAAPQDRYYEGLYQSYAKSALETALEGIMLKSQGQYILTYTLSVGGETFQIRTALEPVGNIFIVSTKAAKVINGVAGYPTRVDAELKLSDATHTEIYQPVFTWATLAPPFAFALYAEGDILCEDGLSLESPALLPYVFPEAPALSDILVESIPLTNSVWRPDNALLVTNADTLDVSSFYAGSFPVPTLILHTGTTPLNLMALDEERANFIGVVVSHNTVKLTDIQMVGHVFSGEDITLIGAADIQYQPETVFRIPLEAQTQRAVLDYLGLTRFSEAGGGAVSDMAFLLHYVTFDLSPDDAPKLLINNFDAAALAMVKSKKIAN